MGKKSKLKIGKKGKNAKPNATANKAAATTARKEIVHLYKQKTQAFKSGLQTVCGPKFFVKDTVKSFGRAVDKDVLAELIPPLRDAIRGRIKVAATYKQNDHSFDSHQFFIDHLQEQHNKLEKMAYPIPRTFLQANTNDCDINAETVLEGRKPSNPLSSNENVGSSASAQPSILPYVMKIREFFTQPWDEAGLMSLVTMATVIGDIRLLVGLLQLSQGSVTDRLMRHAMQISSLSGNLAIIDSLVQLGCPVDGSVYQGETPMLLAGLGNHADVVRYSSKQQGFNINTLCGFDMTVSGYPQNKKPPLHNVVAHSTVTLQMVECLLSCGADPNARCAYTRGTALHHAAAGTRADVVRALIKAGADVHVRGVTGETPMHTAAVWGRTEIVKCLLENGATVDCQNNNKDMPIHSACEDGHVDVIKVLRNIDAKDGKGRTPLVCAIVREHAKLACALVEMGANVDTPDQDQDTPLTTAITLKQTELACFLVRMGANANAANSVGPVLHKTTKQYELAKLLMEHGADATAQESDGETPLHLLCRHSDSPSWVMTLLLDRGANVNAIAGGTTPLCWAFANGNANLAKDMLQHGADPFTVKEIVDSLGS